MEKKKTVFVGLSGGVDSSVAALRLIEQGYNVVGVFIKVWHPEFLECNWEAERLDAMRVAAHLGIPFLMCDSETVYKQEVAEYFINEYKAGRTPNPDVMCNKAVKFGDFLRFSLSQGADYIATGHYARRIEKRGKYRLHRGNDTNKDQSYFLWTLNQEHLSKILFPVGDTPKAHIRKEALTAGIPVATKDDSQGICFLGHVDIPDFLSHYIDLSEGNVLNEDGLEIGTHKGALVYTYGQRHGFSVTKQSGDVTPLYVIGKNLEANTITVSETHPTRATGQSLQLHSVNFTATPVSIAQKLTVQTRYRQNAVPAEIISSDETNLTLKLLDSHEITAPGQSCVLYDGRECLGGGIISE